MKKSISVFLIISMLVSCVAFAVPASAKATADNIAYVEALYFEKAPTIDGYISEAEWGSATFEIEIWNCATTDDTSPWYEFFYNRYSATNRDDYGLFMYTVWLRWDLNKFYIGVKVKDPDIHSSKNGTTNTWNGDSLIVRVDKSGANAATGGGDFTITADRKKPWSTNNVPEFLFGYVEIAGGFSEAWENVSNKGMTSFSNNPLGVTSCVVAPAGSNYSTDTQAGITTYEIAIPWAYIYNGEYDTLEWKEYAAGRDTYKKGPRGALGKELGMSMAVMNDGANATAGWDAFMAWGSGICEAHQTEGALAASGSNSVTLVETKATQTAGYKTYDPTPLLDATYSRENIDAPDVYYDYLCGDTEKVERVYYSELVTLTYDDYGDLSIWGAPEYGGKISNFGGEHGNVLDYTDMTAVNIQTYIDTRDGTVEYLYPTSYTFEFDIMYTAVAQMVEGFGSELYNWFGGASGYDFQCGYFFNDNAFKVVNTHNINEVLSTYSYDLKKNTWYNWKFQYDNESCTARLWIDDLSTEADNAESGTAGQLGYTGKWGTLVVNSCWRYYYYSTEKQLTQGTLLLFRQMNVKTAYDNVKIYNFATLAECLHENTTEYISVYPTCIAPGKKETYCYDCETVIERKNLLPYGHGEKIILNAYAPTCIAAGYTGDTVCVVCFETLNRGITIPAEGHSDVEGTCTKCGVYIPVGDGIKYFLSDGKAVIVGYSGQMTELEIPESIDKFPVEMIAPCAFYDNNTIKKIILPDSVKEIGAYAFRGCQNLTVVSMGDNVYYIGESAFENCEKLKTVLYNGSEAGFDNITVEQMGNEPFFGAVVICNTGDILVGDVDKDGRITSLDSNMIRRMIIGVVNIDEKSDMMIRADINGDGAVNSRDSNLIKRLICGLIIE